MTNIIILSLCILILLAYIFDISSRYSKIPGVILLIGLGIVIQLSTKALNFEIPNMRPILPVLGTVGLIMIVLEASLDLKLEKEKRGLITRAVTSAIILFTIFTGLFTLILSGIMDIPLKDSILNGIPLGIISSAVAIPAAAGLNPDGKEFIVYESSFSDIFGIIIFDFILLNQGTIGHGILIFTFNTFLTVLISVILTAVLAFLLHKTTYHINYVIIMTVVVLAYILAKMSHLPALLMVLAFGLILSNNRFLENTPVKRYIDFSIFRNDLRSFTKVLAELTFLIRSFFFIMFGYYTKVEGLFNPQNLVVASCIIAAIFIFRYIILRLLMRQSGKPLLFFAPRGMITILLFLSIPAVSRISLISEEVITLVILLTIFLLLFGNLIYKNGHSPAKGSIIIRDDKIIDEPIAELTNSEPVSRI
jgi:potassium/hydrogen antiporter